MEFKILTRQIEEMKKVHFNLGHLLAGRFGRDQPPIPIIRMITSLKETLVLFNLLLDSLKKFMKSNATMMSGNYDAVTAQEHNETTDKIIVLTKAIVAWIYHIDEARKVSKIKLQPIEEIWLQYYLKLRHDGVVHIEDSKDYKPNPFYFSFQNEHEFELWFQSFKFTEEGEKELKKLVESLLTPEQSKVQVQHSTIALRKALPSMSAQAKGAIFKFTKAFGGSANILQLSEILHSFYSAAWNWANLIPISPSTSSRP